jgi:hypothetical protein
MTEKQLFQKLIWTRLLSRGKIAPEFYVDEKLRILPLRIYPDLGAPK